MSCLAFALTSWHVIRNMIIGTPGTNSGSTPIATSSCLSGYLRESTRATASVSKLSTSSGLLSLIEAKVSRRW